MGADESNSLDTVKEWIQPIDRSHFDQEYPFQRVKGRIMYNFNIFQPWDQYNIQTLKILN